MTMSVSTPGSLPPVMRVKLLVNCVANGPHKAGDEVELPGADAMFLIQSGMAHVPPPQPSPKPGPVPPPPVPLPKPEVKAEPKPEAKSEAKAESAK